MMDVEIVTVQIGFSVKALALFSDVFQVISDGAWKWDAKRGFKKMLRPSFSVETNLEFQYLKVWES